MSSFASVYHSIHSKIILAVQSGVISQSSLAHILALKVAHEGEEKLSEPERRYYHGRVEPLLNGI